MNALEFRHIYKQYGDFSIRDLDLALPEGCILGLVGENGAGKSTAIRMLLGSVRPDSGEITVLGQPQDRDFYHVRQQLGVALDEPGFTECLTVRQVSAIMALTYEGWDNDRFYDLLRRLDVPEDKRFREYSRGMKMKLSIAVALSHGARLLLLDEATSGLDPVVRDALLDMLFEYTRDERRSVLMSSHIVSDLEKVCDYIAFLHRGRLVEFGEKDALLEKYGLVRGSREQLAALGPAVRGRKETPYGAEALVERAGVPAGTPVQGIGLEDLFVYLVKEETQYAGTDL